MTKKYEDRMTSAVKHLESEYSSVRAGRANPGVLDKVTVDIDDFYYEIINEKTLVVNIDVLINNLEEKVIKEIEVET